jgi:hypothetical protein
MIISALRLSGGAILRDRLSNAIERASYTAPAFVQHMRVNHRGRHIRMAQQFLHRAYVVADLQEVSGERMALMSTSA